MEGKEKVRPRLTVEESMRIRGMPGNSPPDELIEVENVEPGVDEKNFCQEERRCARYSNEISSHGIYWTRRRAVSAVTDSVTSMTGASSLQQSGSGTISLDSAYGSAEDVKLSMELAIEGNKNASLSFVAKANMTFDEQHDLVQSKARELVGKYKPDAVNNIAIFAIGEDGDEILLFDKDLPTASSRIKVGKDRDILIKIVDRAI